jgi:hypothetical protein
VWPGAARVDRLMAGLAAIPGVQVDGVWKAIGAPVSGGHDAELLAQVAANPADGLATLIDAVPGLLASDWAAAVVVPADWASQPSVSDPSIAYASWRAPTPMRLPDVTPLRSRPMTGPDGVKYAVAPFGRAGLVLLTAREDDAAGAFHTTEVDRVAQLVRAAAVILGDRLDQAGVPPVASVVTDPS